MRLAIAFFGLLIVASGPLIQKHWPSDASSPVWVGLPEISNCKLGSWQLADWRPRIPGSLAPIEGSYDCDGSTVVHVAVHQFLTQRQGAEAVGGANLILPEHLRFTKERRKVGGADFLVDAYSLTWNKANFFVWSWYAIGTTATNSRYLAKLLDVRNVVLLRKEPSVIMIIAGSSRDQKSAQLQLEQVAGSLWLAYQGSFKDKDGRDD